MFPQEKLISEPSKVNFCSNSGISVLAKTVHFILIFIVHVHIIPIFNVIFHFLHITVYHSEVRNVFLGDRTSLVSCNEPADYLIHNCFLFQHSFSVCGHILSARQLYIVIWISGVYFQSLIKS